MRIRHSLSTLFAGLALSSPLCERVPSCPITFEGRIPATKSLSDFDSANTTPYSPTAVLASNQKWSRILSFPNIGPSLYDSYVGAKPFQITINDQSIVQPPGAQKLSGVRRAELMPGPLRGETAFPRTLFTGQQTLHFSLQYDDSKPLNYSHEYMLFFLEATDVTVNQLFLRTGALLDGLPTGADPSQPALRNLYLFGNSKSNKNILFRTAFAPGWHNFAFELDFNRNTVKVWYSRGGDALVPVTDTISNDLSGYGTVHIGLLKKPTGAGANPDRYNYSGRQENNINEAVTFGGIFEESGSINCSMGNGDAGSSGPNTGGTDNSGSSGSAGSAGTATPSITGNGGSSNSGGSGSGNPNNGGSSNSGGTGTFSGGVGR